MDEPIFEKSIKYTIKNKFYVFVLIFMEFIPIFVECIYSVNKIFNLKVNEDNNFILTALSYVDPYGLFKRLITCSIVNNRNQCSFPIEVYLVSFGFHIILFFATIYFLVREEYKNKTNIDIKESKYINAVVFFFVNYLDFFTRVLTQIMFYIGFNCFSVYFPDIYNPVNVQNKSTSFFLIILFFIFMVIFIFTQLRIISAYYLMIQFDPEVSFPQDSLFSKKYNNFLFIMKILIALENSFTQGVTAYTHKHIFLNILIISSFYFFIIFILVTTFNKEILFIINYRFNMFKIFLIFFTVSMFTMKIIFLENMVNNNLFFVIGFLCCLFIAISVSSYIDKSIYTSIYNHSPANYISQAINIFYIKNTGNYGSDLLSSLFYRHKYLCGYVEEDEKSSEREKERRNHIPKGEHSYHQGANTQSNKKHPSLNNSCLICKQSEFSYSNFLTSFKYEIKNYFNKEIKNIKFNSNLLNEKEFHDLSYEFYEFINLIFIEQLEKRKFIKIAFKIKKILNRYFNKNMNSINNRTFYFNLLFFFKHTNNNNNNFVYKFQIIKKFEENRKLFLESLNELKKLLDSYNSQITHEVFSTVKSVNRSRRKIYTNLENLMNYKEMYTETYPLIVSKYIFENLFNSKLEDNIFNSLAVNEDEDVESLMSFHYHKDTFIKIGFNVDSNTMTLIKVSRGLKEFRFKKFDDLFHRKFKKEGVMKFIKLMKENTNERIDEERSLIKGQENKFIYDYIIKQNPTDQFVNLVKMECSISPSIDLNEFLIYGEFNISKNDIIVFEKNQGNEKKEKIQNLITFSSKFSKYLYLTPSLIEYLGRFYDIYLTFEKIFQKINLNLQENLNLKQQTIKFNKLKNIKIDGEHITVYEIDYSKFYKIYLGISDKISNLEENSKSLNELKNLSTSRSTLKLYMSKNTEISKNYTIYSILNIEKSERDPSDADNTLNKKNSEVNLNSLQEINTYVYNDTSSASSTASSIYNKRNFNFSKNKKMDEKFAKNNSLMLLTQISVILCILIVIYCMVDMVIGLMSRSSLENLSLILQKFSIVQSYFYHTSRSLLNHYKLNNKTSISYPIGDYPNLGMKEMEIKLDYLQTNIIELQEMIQSSKYKILMESIFQETVEYSRLSIRANKISYYNSRVLFFDSLKIFINNVKMIINENKQSTPIYILTFKNNFADFSNLEDKNLSENEVLAHEFLINYSSFIKVIKILDSSLRDQIKSSINSIFQDNLNFIYILMGIHFFLLTFYFFIFRFFKTILRVEISSINTIMDIKLSKYLYTKFVFLQSLNELYEEDPKKSIKKLVQIKKEHKENELKGRIDSKKPYSEKINLENLSDNCEIYYINDTSLLNPLYKIIFFIFTFYYTYTLLLYSFLVFTKAQVQDAMTFYIDFNIEVNQLYDNANMIQILIMTNRTDYETKNLVYDTNNFLLLNSNGYIWQQNDIVLQNNINSKRESFYNEFSLVIKVNNIINCKNFCSNNDPIFSKLSDIYGFNFITTLTDICNKFDVMKNNNIGSIIEEISFLTRKLIAKYDEYESNQYLEKMPSIYGDQSYKQMNYLVLYVLRPLHNYIIENVILNNLNSFQNSFFIVLLSFLSLNIIIEIIISLIIYKKIILKVQNLIQDLNNFIDMLKINSSFKGA